MDVIGKRRNSYAAARQSRLLYNAGLIWDNRIPAVPTAVVSRADGQQINVGETVVSTFGILIGSQIYTWEGVI